MFRSALKSAILSTIIVSSTTAQYEPPVSSMTNPWQPSTTFVSPTSSNLPQYHPFTISHCPSFKCKIHDSAGYFISMYSL
jgi:hypothetical protein